MSEHPILFLQPTAGEMVCAVLDKCKTQHRWSAKPYDPTWTDSAVLAVVDGVPLLYEIDEAGDFRRAICPRVKPGDRLWLRESWAVSAAYESYPVQLAQLSCHVHAVAYRVGGRGSFEFHPGEQGRWRPSTNMPRWASRIRLEVTDVRAQRIQDITEEDAMAEGFGGAKPRVAFFRGWDAIYASKGLGVDANPWVWAVTFSVIVMKGEEK